jgi:hypothetical protein
MATAKPITSKPPRRLGRKLALLAAVLIVAALVWIWRPLNAYALTGAAYGARVACSCRYVAGRSLAHCRDDFEPGMGLIRLSEDEDTHSVTARFPLLARQTATFRPGEGCLLETWAD